MLLQSSWLIGLHRLRTFFACPCGGTGRRAALKMRYREMCRFESGQGHHSFTRPKMVQNWGFCLVGITRIGRYAPNGHRPAPREMTAERLSCWPPESRTGFGHRLTVRCCETKMSRPVSSSKVHAGHAVNVLLKTGRQPYVFMICSHYSLAIWEAWCHCGKNRPRRGGS
jgi:hypothetical protein